MRLTSHLLIVFALGGALLAGAGCGSTSLRDQREERDPLLKRAREKKNAQDIPGAVEAYLRAIDKRPQLARAHLELAWIYDHDLEDYVRAIYHYQRYLELNPNAEKQDLVRDLIAHARISFAASLPDQPSEAIRRISMLEQENATLRAQLESTPPARATASAAAPVAVAPTPAPVAQPAAPVAAKPATPSAPVTMTPYVVQPGDTLSRIAGKVYGDSRKWQQIYDANRSALPGGPQSVKVGQTLSIPKTETR